MLRSQHPKVSSCHLRFDALKAAFTSVTEAGNKPIAQLLRDLMRAYVRRAERRALDVEAKRQSGIIVRAAENPDSDEAQIMREMDSLTDAEGWPEWSASPSN